jgi:hypothetical protein
VKYGYCAITIYTTYEIKVSNTLYRLSMLNKVSVFTYISCLVLKTAEFMSEFSRRTYMTNMLRKILNHLKNSRRNDPKISTKWSRIQQYYTLKQTKKSIEMLNLQRNWKNTTGKSKERRKRRRLQISSHLSFKSYRWRIVPLYMAYDENSYRYIQTQQARIFRIFLLLSPTFLWPAATFAAAVNL